mgnify:FL=1
MKTTRGAKNEKLTRSPPETWAVVNPTRTRRWDQNRSSPKSWCKMIPIDDDNDNDNDNERPWKVVLMTMKVEWSSIWWRKQEVLKMMMSKTTQRRRWWWESISGRNDCDYGHDGVSRSNDDYEDDVSKTTDVDDGNSGGKDGDDDNCLSWPTL